MRLKQKSPAELAELAAQKLLLRGDGGRETVVYLPPSCLPPSRAYRTEKFSTQYGEMTVFARPSTQGGWIVKVRFKNPIVFNPAFPKEAAEKLQQKAAEKPQQK